MLVNYLFVVYPEFSGLDIKPEVVFFFWLFGAFGQV